ncbi:superinfection immunity protein [Sanguibacter sp. A247]|uniref:superinfection immunity protein n=1 Tax=unclassified Sanguibacter TaxID=2645534 RepID=UPI003FD7E38C
MSGSAHSVPGSAPNASDPYGTTPQVGPSAAAGASDPYGTSYGSASYGSGSYGGASSYGGTPPSSPDSAGAYGSTSYGSSPYGGASYGSGSYGSSSYGGAPYGGSTGDPYGAGGAGQAYAQQGYTQSAYMQQAYTQQPDSTLLIVSWIVTVFTGFYMLPWAVAATRRAGNSTTIAIVTLLTAWTVIGWIACLAWACVSQPTSPSAAPPGWYPSTTGTGTQYWDGRSWTGHTQP